MFTSLVRVLVITLLGLAAVASRASAQETLAGNVVNEATGRALEGARVALQGTQRETITDRQGAFRFDNLAPGPVTLLVSYAGLDPANVPVTVAAGQPTQREVRLSSQIYAMTKFVVAGEREGNAQAVTLQRLSDGVKNVVSTDAFGNLA
jgi:hypothetical protein